ncbi:hypothetical protein Hanom_Chr09g00819821 [Helianthus anomalus]
MHHSFSIRSRIRAGLNCVIHKIYKWGPVYHLVMVCVNILERVNYKFCPLCLHQIAGAVL